MPVETDATECPICGYELPQPSGAYRWWSLAAVLALLLFLYLFVLS
jgi:hypothetical protein